MRSKSQILSKLRADGHITDEEYKALKQEPCTDAISRQAVLDGIADLKKSPWFNDDTNGAKFIRKEAVEIIEALCIKSLPSVTPQEPKTGHWIELPTHESQSGLPWYECSECNSERCIAVLRDFKYCPNCSAKMAESEVSQKEQAFQK